MKQKCLKGRLLFSVCQALCSKLNFTERKSLHRSATKNCFRLNFAQLTAPFVNSLRRTNLLNKFSLRVLKYQFNLWGTNAKFFILSDWSLSLHCKKKEINLRIHGLHAKHNAFNNKEWNKRCSKDESYVLEVPSVLLKYLVLSKGSQCQWHVCFVTFFMIKIPNNSLSDKIADKAMFAFTSQEVMNNIKPLPPAKNRDL